MTSALFQPPSPSPAPALANPGPLLPPSGRWEDGRHRFPIRIHWENTDAGGIVYHSEYLKFAERARTEMLRLAGIDQRRMLEDSGLAFAVAHLSIAYRRPARLDDALVVDSRLDHMGGALLDLVQTIRRDAEVLAELSVRVACLSQQTGGPARLPPWIRAALTTPSPAADLG